MEPTSPSETPKQAKQGTASASIELHLSEDKMLLTLSVLNPSAHHEEIESSLILEMKRIGILEESDHLKALTALRVAKEEGKTLSELPLLKGTPPVPGEDAKLSWTRDYFAKGFSVDDETGAIDFRERLAEDNVHEGEHLADLCPPIPGEEGVNIFGQRIAVPEGQSMRVKTGNGVRVEGQKLVADTDGRIRFTNDTIAVDHVLIVEGSIGLGTGNVDHPGALIVKQNIEAETTVSAKGSIEVDGYVEDAEIIAGGDLSVRGGIIGAPGRKIRVKGDVHAKFLKNVDLEADGDVVAVNGLEQCTVKTRGRIIVPQGRIVGGETIALMGIDVGEIGSEACVKTYVTTGKDYLLSRRLDESEAELSTLNKNVEKIEAAIAPHEKNKTKLSPEALKKYEMLKKQATQMQRRIDSFDNELETLSNEYKEKASYEILVRGRVHPATSATIGSVTKLINEEAPGPLSISIHNGDVKLLKKRIR